MSCLPEPYILDLYPGNEETDCDDTAKEADSQWDQYQDQDQDQEDPAKIYSIHIYNLPPWIKWRDLKSLLISYVQDTSILHIQIWQNAVMNALVSLTTQEDSIELYNVLNNFEWNGFILTVGIENNIALPQPQYPQGYYPQFLQPVHQAPPSSDAFSPPNYYNFVPLYPNLPTNVPQAIPQIPPPSQGPPLAQIPPPPGPFRHPYLSPPQQNPSPYYQFPYQQQHMSRPPSKHRHASISGPFYHHQSNSPYTRYPTHSRSHSTSLLLNSTSQSPKIQPSRQINLHQLNYQDITEINDSPPDKTRLFIGNIPFESEWIDLKDFLRTYGHSIIRVEIPQNDTGSKGFGIATFQYENDAENVIKNCNGAMFQGRPLTVRYDKYPRIRPTLSASPERPTPVIVEDKKNIIPEENEDISFDDGEFAKEARNLVESLNLNSLK